MNRMKYSLYLRDFNEKISKFSEGTRKVGDVNSANPAILEIQQKDVNYVVAKPRDQRTTIVIEKVVNASAKRITMAINVTSVRYVFIRSYYVIICTMCSLTIVNVYFSFLLKKNLFQCVSLIFFSSI